MKHLSHEQLWELAQTNPPAGETHLDSCVSCLSALDDIKLAQSVLRDVPEPPPMPMAMARRVEGKLADALEARQARAWTSWFPGFPRFAFAALAVIALAIGAWLLAQQQRKPDLMARSPIPEVTAPVVMPVPAAPKLTATVASAKRARNASGALSTTQVLREGSLLTTEKGGSLWVRLPDGSRAGLTSASQMQLHTLEEKTLTLDLAKGSVALVVPHREDRVLTVRAGDLEVIDLGTQFLVSRELGRIVVAVEEGSVEVRVPGLTRTVTAGHAVAYHQGQLDELQPLPTLAPVAPKHALSISAPTPDLALSPEPEPQVSLAAAELVVETPDEAPPPPEVDDPAAEWALPPPTAPSAGPNDPPAPLELVVTATRPGLSLGAIERRVDALSRQIRMPFTQGGSLRQQRAKDIARMADGGECPRAIDNANEWLRYARDAPEEAMVRREVLFQKMRCLRRMGRLPEADLVRREMEAIQ